MRGKVPIFLILATIFVILLAVLSQDPSQSERFAEMRRAVAFQGEAREAAMLLIFVGIAAFAAYLMVTRR